MNASISKPTLRKKQSSYLHYKVGSWAKTQPPFSTWKNTKIFRIFLPGALQYISARGSLVPSPLIHITYIFSSVAAKNVTITWFNGEVPNPNSNMTQAIKLLVLYNSTFFHCKCILTGPQNDLLEAILVNEHKNEFYYIKLTYFCNSNKLLLF